MPTDQKAGSLIGLLRVYDKQGKQSGEFSVNLSVPK